MDPLRATTTANARSPSPAIPGAWPATPLHKRSLTCPVPTQSNAQPQHVPASATLPEPLHLDRVLNFHQRLSLALSEPNNNTKKHASFTVTPSCPNASPSMPSDDSDLTKYNPNDTSLSVVDTSVATSRTSPMTPDRVLFKSLEESSPSPQMNDNVRIHGQKTRNHAHSSEPNHIFGESSPAGPSTSFPSPGMLANSSFSSSPCPSPTSPMVFNSPSPSILPPRSRTRTSSSQASYDHLSSLSCITSSEEDFGVVRTYEPSRSLSPSPSSHASWYNQALRMPVLYTPDRVSPSVEELAPPTIPMLTGLSLPGTPDDSLSIDGNPVSNSFLASPRSDVNEPEWTLALSAATPTPTASVSVHDTSPSLSLSPTSSFRAQLNLDAAEHVLSFPSHNPSSAGASVEPSPTIGMSETGSLETSAAEYAAAVMSSVWSSHNPSLEPIVIETTTRVELSDDNRRTRSVASDRPARAGSRQSWNKKREILLKVKMFGGRVKQLLARGVGREERRKELPRPHSAPSMRTPSPPGVPSLDLGDDVHPLERGSSEEGNHRIRRPRPSLTTHTYTPVNTGTSDPSTSPPSIRVLPPSAPTTPYTNDRAVPKSESDVVANAQIAMHARPKTLAEIKSGRRFSLSAITRLTRLSSPPSASSVLISPPRRRRPVSALALPSRRPDSFQFDVQNVSLRDSDVQGPVIRSGRRSVPTSLRPPPGLDIPSTRGATPSPEPVAGPSRVRFSLDVEKTKKNTRRRFSLSALSTFAAGLKGEGSWTRHQSNEH
ncbi:uncharacterized protein EV420DRAFT_1512860 [Desarmillaria tabescens]|uniref:Uncharacterized protein n=1 Tax=Armillaria tabescens TaxID=1929756 RepID=A0AA39NGB3_ARMTA|nr:uncharacterized protein EV420DRAFT_1512860 [Desarmillaria tabescens]KAK0465111.1 hypothetical protein EV420DRAFT_1512860 [Desarmillaria tabescens]